MKSLLLQLLALHLLRHPAERHYRCRKRSSAFRFTKGGNHYRILRFGDAIFAVTMCRTSPKLHTVFSQRVSWAGCVR